MTELTHPRWSYRGLNTGRVCEGLGVRSRGYSTCRRGELVVVLVCLSHLRDAPGFESICKTLERSRAAGAIANARARANWAALAHTCSRRHRNGLFPPGRSRLCVRCARSALTWCAHSHTRACRARPPALVPRHRPCTACAHRTAHPRVSARCPDAAPVSRAHRCAQASPHGAARWCARSTASGTRPARSA